MIVTRNNWLLGHMIFWLFVLIFTMSIPEMRQNANCWHVAVPFGLPKLRHIPSSFSIVVAEFYLDFAKKIRSTARGINQVSIR